MYFAGVDSHIEKNDIETEEVEQDENEQLSDNEETEEAEYNENEDEPSEQQLFLKNGYDLNLKSNHICTV